MNFKRRLKSWFEHVFQFCVKLTLNHIYWRLYCWIGPARCKPGTS